MQSAKLWQFTFIRIYVLLLKRRRTPHQESLRSAFIIVRRGYFDSSATSDSMDLINRHVNTSAARRIIIWGDNIA